jgi:hypothetical protein
MFFDIQTDPSFPAYAEDAEMGSLQMQEQMTRHNDVGELLATYRPVEITDASGNVFLVLAVPQGQISSTGNPWDLTAATNGEFTINAGRIFKSFGDAEDTYSIAGIDKKFKPTAADFVYLEVIDLLSPVITLKIGKKWTGHPKVFEVDGEDEVAQFKAARFLLWEFKSGTLPTTERGRQISKDLWGKQIARSNDLTIMGGSHKIDETSKRRIPAPFLVAL